MRRHNKIGGFLAVGLGILLVSAVPALGDANMIINNVDAPGVGFNDTTPAVPVGGNIGTTVGMQRLIAYRFALDLWSARLDSSVDIVIQGSFAGLPCNAGGGVLAQAGAIQIFSDFPNAPIAGTWWGVALANAVAGVDLAPGPPDPGPLQPPFADDIVANFNGNVGQPNCIAGPGWYYGLDNNPPPGYIDFLNTFMHEVAHGLGFQNYMNESTGALAGGMQDIYTIFSYDNTTGQTHAEMATDEERMASSINTGNVVWIGPAVTAEAPNVLSDREFMEITAPPAIAGEIAFGTASFGPTATPANFAGDVVLADDGTGTSSDGCQALNNGADIAGNIALIDRGACAFTVKALNAQAAGATGVMIANNAGGAIGLGGSDPNVMIPTVGIGQDDGTAIKGELPGVSVQLSVDPTQLAGADPDGRVRLNAPNPVQPGSSISHYDPLAVPNLLMEPSITSTLHAKDDVDLTDDLFIDIGWTVNENPDLPVVGVGCQESEPTETIMVLGCDTGVPNTTVADVCLLSDIIEPTVEACAAGARNHGQFVRCMSSEITKLRRIGVVDTNDHGNIMSCTAQSDETAVEGRSAITGGRKTSK